MTLQPKQRAARFACLLPLLPLALYLSFRDPSWRAVDYAWLTITWRLLWQHVGSTPELLEPALARTGIIRYRPVIATVPWGPRLLLDPGDFVDKSLLLTGTWEETEWDWVRSSLPANGTFVDVGAHHGTYSLRAASLVGPGGLVIAIEPNPTSIRRLRQNLALNKFSNVIVEPVACGDREDTLRLYSASGQNTGMTSLSQEIAGQSGRDGGLRAVDVPVLPLDAVLGPWAGRPISFIKIDTEGAETMVLRGARRTLLTHRPVLLVEVIHDQLHSMGSSVKELEDLIGSFGYYKAAASTFNALWKPR